MQQFVVPQFIEVEDQILGPITIRQFLILLVGGLINFLAYKFADFTLFIVTVVVIGGLSLVFAFVKVNGQTFHYFVLNLIQTLRRPGLRVWGKWYSNDELKYLIKKGADIEPVETTEKKAARHDHIRDLSLI